MGLSRVFLCATAAVALLLCACEAHTERRALLIGVPNTPGFPSWLSLEGPANDVEVLREALLANWGFVPGNIDTLVGASASRAGILDALERLAGNARAGDQFFIYFSGFGISAHDQATKGFGMDPGTGALVPADVQDGSAEEIVAGLIVANRDLRPYFERLDRSGADTFVAFDADYSGAMLNPVEPYERLVYLSASARDEVAYDTPESEAGPGGRWPTIDGRAHGDFTNGLLLALRGEADLDSDGQITYVELHKYLRVHLDGRQTPQLHPAGKPVVNGPVLGQVVDVLERRATAKRIWGLAYPAQDLRTRIKIDPDQDRYRGGTLISLTLKASEPAWHLLLSIDSHGRIFVLYPYEQSDVRRAAAEEEVLVVSTNVGTPYGPERLVAFAFKDRPSGYGEWDWLGKNKPLDGAATEDLIAMLQERASEPGRAKTHRTFYSYSGP